MIKFYPTAPGFWWGRLVSQTGDPRGPWQWWHVLDDLELSEGRPAWAWPTNEHSRTGHRLGFIEWDPSVTPIHERAWVDP